MVYQVLNISIQIPDNVVKKWENRKNQTLTVDVLQQICNHLALYETDTKDKIESEIIDYLTYDPSDEEITGVVMGAINDGLI